MILMSKHQSKLISFVIFLFASQILCAQTTVSGKISDAFSKAGLENVSIISKKGEVVLAYTYSSKDGRYSLKIPTNDSISLTFNSLGYNPQSKLILPSAKNSVVTMDIELTQQTEQLEAVIIENDPPIDVQKDKIIFSTKYFTNGTEASVEDLLRKIPGLNIDDQGNILIGNQEVEKVMIENDDFFGKGYKLLTKNMPAFPVEKVEVLQHYSNNELLKGIENSNKVALNLKLNDNAKRVWFGNISAGLGNRNFYKAKGNLMNFGKNAKYYLLGNISNIGESTISDIDKILYDQYSDEAGYIGEDEKLGKITTLSAYTPNIDNERTNFNKDKLISLNAIFSPSDKIKIKPLFFVNYDNQLFYRTYKEHVNTETIQFSNSEQYKLNSKALTLSGKLHMKFTLSEHETLNSITNYNSIDNTNKANLVFNTKPILEHLKSNRNRFDQNIIYTNKFKEQKAFILSGRYIHEDSPEDFTVNQFTYHNLFPDITAANQVYQRNKSQMSFAGINGLLMLKGDNGNLLELELGNTYRSDKLNSHFIIQTQQDSLISPNAYQNQSRYNTNDLYAKGKYSIDLNTISVTGGIEVHQLFNHLTEQSTEHRNQVLYINPNINIDWELNKDNSLLFSYELTKNNVGILDIYSNYILTGFRSFDRGLGDIQQLNASRASLFYQFGNWADSFFANASVIYIKNHDFLSTNTILSQDVIQTEKLLIKNRNLLTTSSQLNYYFKSLSVNLKAKLGYSQSNYKNVINHSALRSISSSSYRYGFEIRSSFTGLFNFHIGTIWQNHEMNADSESNYTDQQAFFNINLLFSSKFDLSLQSNYYYFGNLEKDKTYTFLDIKANYALIKDKLSLQLEGKNLLNTDQFRTYNISDIGTSVTSYRLLPRMVLLNVKYRF